MAIEQGMAECSSHLRTDLDAGRVGSRRGRYTLRLYSPNRATELAQSSRALRGHHSRGAPAPSNTRMGTCGMFHSLSTPTIWTITWIPFQLRTNLEPPTTHHPDVNPRPSPINGGCAPLPPPQVSSVRLGLTHLSVHEFGSRFVPHSILPIHALLPLPSTHYLLIADSEGLAMLDIIPEDGPISAEAHIAYVHALEAAKRRDLWFGEG